MNETLRELMKLDTSIPVSKDMEIIDDDAFDYDGYQVVRGEFFAHTYEPSFTFNKYKVSVNKACIKKLPNIEYVQILVNPDEKKLVVKPCPEEEKDSFRWCMSNNKRSPKQIKCNIFFAKVFKLMGWDPDYRYKLLGKLVRSENQLLFVFDLTTPEIFIRTRNNDGKEVTSRKPTYPDEWNHQFGIPYSQHQIDLQINIIDGYAVFGLRDSENNDRAAIEGTSENAE